MINTWRVSQKNKPLLNVKYTLIENAIQNAGKFKHLNSHNKLSCTRQSIPVDFIAFLRVLYYKVLIKFFIVYYTNSNSCWTQIKNKDITRKIFITFILVSCHSHNALNDYLLNYLVLLSQIRGQLIQAYHYIFRIIFLND